MTSRPVAIPEVFTGEGSQSWSDWQDHFDSVAEVNGWNAADKKKWVRARLTGRAATAMRRLSDTDKASFDTICAALKKRFEPECRKEVYMAEFQAKKKRRNEDWASFGEDLKTLVEKAYPSLQAEAQELLALNQLLSQIEDPQLSFAVRQRAPATVDAAVAAVLEMETYLQPRVPVAAVKEELAEGSAAASVVRRPSELSPLQKVMEQLDKLEALIRPREGGSRTNDRRGQKKDPTTITCWNCKEEGHISRNCPEKHGDKKQVTFATVSWATEHPRQARKTRSVQSSVTGVISQENNFDWLVEVQVNGVPANCLVDRGAGSTILSRGLWEQIGVGNELRQVKGDRNLVDAQGSPLKSAGLGEVKLQFGMQLFQATVIVVDTLTVDLILGRDFLRQHKCSVELGEQNLLRLNEAGVTVALGLSKKQQEPSAAVATDNTFCPRNSKKRNYRADKTLNQAEIVTQQTQQQKVAVAKTVVMKGCEQIPLRINKKPKKEDAATRIAKDGPRVKKSWNLVVPEQPLNHSGRNEDNNRCDMRKRKRDWRKMRRECRPPDKNLGRISSKEGVM